VVTHGRRVESVEGKDLLQEFDRQSIGHQGRKLGLEIEAFRGGALGQEVSQGTERLCGMRLAGTVEEPVIRETQRPKQGPIDHRTGPLAVAVCAALRARGVLGQVRLGLLGDHRTLYTRQQGFRFAQRQAERVWPELLAWQVGDVLDELRGSTVRFDDDLYSDVHHGSPARLLPLPGLVPTRILSEPAIDGRAIKTLHREPVPKVVQLFHGLVVFPALADLHQPLSDMDQGILLPQCHERPYAPTIFGWAGAFARDTDGIAAVGLWCEDGFDMKLVLPVVPKVIVVEETLPQSETKVCEAHLVRVVTEADAPQPGYPILFPVDAELVKVGIRPAHGDLEDMMQIGDGMVTADEQTPPDHRTDAE